MERQTQQCCEELHNRTLLETGPDREQSPEHEDIFDLGSLLEKANWVNAIRQVSL